MSPSIQPLQYLLLAFLVFAISRVYLRVRDGSLSFATFIFWMVLFFLVGIAVIDPLYTTLLANRFGIGRGADVAIYVSVILLFYMIFRTNVMLENLRHDLTTLVRQLALKDLQPAPKSPSRAKKKSPPKSY